MNIHNEITVQAPADELFAFLSDVERVGPCLPGASIEGRDGDDYAGRMKVKVGPINATYQGKLRFVELDKEARRAVMRARADEVNGQGNAEASITTEVEEAGEDSVIRMDTDLQMRGKVAQFGRGAMEKISQRMFEEFARNIERQFDGNGTDAQAGGDEEADEAAPAAAGREGGGDDREAGDETGRRGEGGGGGGPRGGGRRRSRRPAREARAGRRVAGGLRRRCVAGRPRHLRRSDARQGGAGRGGRGARLRLRRPARAAARVAGHGAADGAPAVTDLPDTIAAAREAGLGPVELTEACL